MDWNTSQAADADLAIAVAAGDRKALAAIFDRYAPRLLAFSQSMLHNRADAEDCLQDIFILTATRIAGLREPDRLRSWLFAIARHECLRRLERHSREVLVDEIPDRATSQNDHPAQAALDSEMAALIADAIAGLPDRDRLVLDLADRQGLGTDEVAAALAMSQGSAYKLLTRARATARRSIGALLVARTGRSNCTELDALLGNWNGTMTPLLRKRLARHIEECPRCQEQERRVASPAALLGSGTAFAVPIPIGLRSNILDTAYEAQTRAIVAPPLDSWSGGWPPRSPNIHAPSALSGPGRHGPAVAVAAAVAVLLVIGGIFAIRRPALEPEAIRGPVAQISSPASISSTPSRGPASSVPLLPQSTSVSAPRVTMLQPTGPTTRSTTPGSQTFSGTTSSADPRTTHSASPPNTTSNPSRSRTSNQSPTRRTSTTPSSPTKRTTSIRPTSTTPTTPSSRADTSPHITQMSVACQYAPDGSLVPVLSWTTTNTKSTDLSVDNPGVVGSYGSGYPSSGQLELPPNGCDPSQGTQIYTIYANGVDGSRTQQTINWVPPARPSNQSSTAPSSTSSTPTTTTQTTTSATTPPPLG